MTEVMDTPSGSSAVAGATAAAPFLLAWPLLCAVGMRMTHGRLSRGVAVGLMTAVGGSLAGTERVFDALDDLLERVCSGAETRALRGEPRSSRP